MRSKKSRSKRITGVDDNVACKYEYMDTTGERVRRVADASRKERKRYLVLLGGDEVMRRLQTPLGICRGLDMGRVDRVLFSARSSSPLPSFPIPLPSPLHDEQVTPSPLQVCMIFPATAQRLFSLRPFQDDPIIQFCFRRRDNLLWTT